MKTYTIPQMMTPFVLVTVLLLLLSGLVSPVGAQEMSLFSFGKGKTEVKIYSDYFCGACKSLEPRVEFLLDDLVKRNIITLTFIDAPFHTYSAMYAKYFLYILNEKKDLSRALKARTALFDAGMEKIFEAEKLEAYLQKKGLKFKTFDTKATLNSFQTQLRDDRIDSTPTAVIWDGKNKTSMSGIDSIMRALEGLR